MTISSTPARTAAQAELDLARDLIRTHSPSGQERDATELLCRAFTQLGYDNAYIDDAGNAIGVLQRGSGPVIMLNGHLDTVPAGDHGEWRFDPFGAEIDDGMLWGRGAVDMKAAVAAMTLAAADAVERGFSGTLLVTGVVQEEVGGLGSRYLSGQHKPDVIILGEPSNLELKLGHRGRVEVEVTLPGRIAHAAKAALGRNALYEASAFLAALQQLELPAGGPLQASTATPTRLRSFPDGKNVVPGMAEIVVDYRNIPGDTTEQILQRLQDLAPAAKLSVHQEHAVSQNGLIQVSYPQICPPYLADVQHPAVATARATLQRVLPESGLKYAEGVWWFATDAPYLAETGAPVLGFGPGDPELAHTTRECVPVAQLAAARRAYTELLLAFH